MKRRKEVAVRFGGHRSVPPIGMRAEVRGRRAGLLTLHTVAIALSFSGMLPNFS
jgi:hypothetical protein